MNLSFTFRHHESSDSVRSLVTEKLDKKLKPFLDDGADLHVILEVDAGVQRVELTLVQKDIKTSARADSADMYKSLDQAINKLLRQLRRLKERRTDHHR